MLGARGEGRAYGGLGKRVMPYLAEPQLGVSSLRSCASVPNNRNGIRGKQVYWVCVRLPGFEFQLCSSHLNPDSWFLQLKTEIVIASPLLKGNWIRTENPLST